MVVPGLTVGVDAYYKVSNNLIDEGQFGAPIILTAFNYAHGLQEGVELTASYDHGPWSVYGNLAKSRAMGEAIVSAQYMVLRRRNWRSSPTTGSIWTMTKPGPVRPALRTR